MSSVVYSTGVMIHSILQLKPNVSLQAWVAKSAQVIGDVTIDEHVSVWFHSVIRSESAAISIGEATNIQDATVIHTDKNYDVMIGNHVTIGHRCIIHGCTIGNETLIGMGSIVMNGAKIGDHCIIGAGSLIKENTVIPDYSVAVGSPARIVKQVSEQQLEHLKISAQHYVQLAKAYQEEDI